MANLRLREELLLSFEKFLADQQLSQAEPTALYEPVAYILSLEAKRIRPVSLLFFQKLFGGSHEAALHAASSVELFHNFTLMHDDIMDEADLRRGHPSTHKKYGIASAILSGDVMLVQSLVYMRQAEHLASVPGLCDLLLKTAREVCEGQALDMDFEKQTFVSLQQYLQMIEWKTAVLLACCMEIGTLIAGRADLAKSIYELGILVGIGFQLEDDFLDYYAQDTRFGKTKGGDILRGKKSALVLELAACMDAPTREEFLQTYQQHTQPEERLTWMEPLLETYGVHAKLGKRVQTYKDRAHSIIDQLAITSENREAIREWAGQILGRGK